MEKITQISMDRIIEKKLWTRKRIISLLSAIIVLVIISYLLIFKDFKKSIRINTDHVGIQLVKRGEFLDYTVISGQIVPEQVIYLDAMEGGRIEEIYAEEGQMLEKGTPILRLSNSNLQMSMMNRESELADQMNNLRNTRLLMEENRLSIKAQLLDNEFSLIQSKRDYEQTRELYERKLISKNEYLIVFEKYQLYDNKQKLLKETAKQDSVFRSVQIEQLNDSVKRLQGNLKLIREKMDGLLVKAPVTGQLSSFNGEIGQSKNPGEALGTINVINSYKIQSNISEFYLNRIQVGLKASAESNNESFPIRLQKIHPEVKNGSFQVDFIIPNELSKNFHIGQSFLVNIELGKSKESLLLPKGSFFPYTGGQWVFVLSKDKKTAEKIPIKIGGQNPDYYEVLEGLQEGDRVIISGYERLKKAERIIFNK